MKLSLRIRMARQYARLSQMQLAEKLSVTRGAVANWEAASRVNPATARLEQIALITQISYEWLATGRGRMTHRSNPHDRPTMDADLVCDATERRLLQAFREAPALFKLLLLQAVESHAGNPASPLR